MDYLTRHCTRFASTLVISLIATAVPASHAEGDIGVPPEAQRWSVHGGTATISFDVGAMAARELRVGDLHGLDQVLPDNSVRWLTIKRGSTFTFSVVDGSFAQQLGGSLLHLGDLSFITPQGRFVVRDPAIGPAAGDASDAMWVAEPVSGEGGLILNRIKAGFDPTSATLTIRSPEVRMSPALAEALGDPGLADLVLGAVTIRAAAEWFGGAVPDGGVPEAWQAESAMTAGADMTFCQLYGLFQPSGGRLGDTVGLGVATTSWNIGTEDLMWFAMPNEEHPFIVMNLYRFMDGRFEQIGMSCIKHGFYALGSHQCGGPACSYEPGHSSGSWLGTGCTDTYSAGLNVAQSGMGPKYEVNPWTGYWYYPTSHMNGSHSHDAIQHRIQVRDADLDPAQNPGATYYVESYYAVIDDVDVMNSAAWKEVTVSGSPGGTWSFGMSGAGSFPNIGFAIDAWAAARKAPLAQELPVVEFESPDGRCVVACEVTQVNPTTWHYEYALLNIDMDRQVGSFSIPLTPGMNVTNIGFHAVKHHDEPFNTVDADAVSIDNAPWEATLTDDSVTWQTTTNPLRWGTLYNFRFDAQASDGASPMTIGLFRAGTPTQLSATTLGPVLIPCFADIDESGTVDVTDLLAVLGTWGTPGGDVTGDGTTDVTDLLKVLADWGACS